MDRDQLICILKRLNELYEDRLLAENTKDLRRRKKAILEVDKRIADYAKSLPLELKELFDKQVGANSLNIQHADDIGQCVDIVRELLRQMD